jgi:lipoprotein
LKRRLAAALLIATLPLGLAACANTKSESAPATSSTQKPTPSASASSSATPTQKADTQSKKEACRIIVSGLEPIQNLNLADPEQREEGYAHLFKALSSDKITNSEVKAAADTAFADAKALHDFIVANSDSEITEEIEAEAQQLQSTSTTSYRALRAMCAANE